MLMKFLSLLGAEIEQDIYFAAAILKIQNGGHADISANVINDFRILMVSPFRKCIGLLISQNFERN